MSLWRKYAGNMPVGVVLAWTGVVILGWPLMLAVVAAERIEGLR